MRIDVATGIYVGELGNSPPHNYTVGVTDLSTKIRLFRQTLGLNQTEFGRLFSVKQATASRWEKGSIPDPLNLQAIADKMGTSVRDLLGADFTVAAKRGPGLTIKGAVAAGVWREAIEWPEDEWQPYTGGTHIDAPLDRRFGLIVEGESMNVLYPPGTVLDCVSTIGGREIPKSGQRVVVVRRRVDGEYEATVKEFFVDGSGRQWLVPRSHNPAFQTPIAIGAEEDDIEETVIMAIVRGAYLPE